MSSNTIKSTSNSINGVPIPSAPLPAIFYAFFIGIAFVCLLMDSWVLEAAATSSTKELDTLTKGVAAFYYRKEVISPVWYKVVMLTLFVGGIFSHIRLILSVIKRTATSKRNMVDVASIVTYVSCLYYNITVIRPLEQALGMTYLDFDRVQVLDKVGELQYAHLVLIGFFATMMMFQFVAFNVQKILLKEKDY